MSGANGLDDRGLGSDTARLADPPGEEAKGDS
jgi:hypothetical protein